MEQGEVKEYARTLHMKDGILERKLTWTASSGKMTEIHIFRLVSFARKNEPSNYQTSPLIDNFMKDNPQFNNNEEFLTYFKNNFHM